MPDPASLSAPKAFPLAGWVFVLLYIPFLPHNGLLIARQTAQDFPSFYFGARVAFFEHASPYRADAFTEAEKQFAPDTHFFPFIYPPPSLLPFYPLAKLSYRHAQLAMLALNHLALLASLWVILKCLPSQTTRSVAVVIATAVFILYALNQRGVTETLRLGQINLWLLLCLSLTWLGLQRGWNSLWIGLTFSLAVLFKTYPILMLPLLLWRRPRAALAAVILLVFYFAVSIPLLPRAAWSDFAHNVMPTGGYLKTPFLQESPGQAGNESINGFVSRIVVGGPYLKPMWPNVRVGTIVAYALAATVLVTALWKTFRARSGLSEVESRPDSLDQLFCIWLLTIYLVAPLSWHNHTAYLLPVAAVAIFKVAFSQKGAWHRWIVPLALCLVGWEIPHGPQILNRGPLPFLLASKFYGVVLLWIYFVIAWPLESSADAVQPPKPV